MQNILTSQHTEPAKSFNYIIVYFLKRGKDNSVQSGARQLDLYNTASAMDNTGSPDSPSGPASPGSPGGPYA